MTTVGSHSPAKNAKWTLLNPADDRLESPFVFFKKRLKFVDRENESRQIIDIFLDNFQQSCSQKKLVVISQCLGIGKTALAQNFQDVIIRSNNMPLLKDPVLSIPLSHDTENNILQAKLIVVDVRALNDKSDYEWYDKIINAILGSLSDTNPIKHKVQEELMGIKTNPKDLQYDSIRMSSLMNSLARELNKDHYRAILVFDEFMGHPGTATNPRIITENKIESALDRIRRFIIPFIEPDDSQINCIIAGKSEELIYLVKPEMRTAVHLRFTVIRSSWDWYFLMLPSLTENQIELLIKNSSLTQNRENDLFPVRFTANSSETQNEQPYTLGTHFSEEKIHLITPKFTVAELSKTIFELTKGVPRLLHGLLRYMLKKLQFKNPPNIVDSREFVKSCYKSMLETQKAKNDDIRIATTVFDKESDILVEFLLLCAAHQIPMKFYSSWKVVINGKKLSLPLYQILMTLNIPFSYQGAGDILSDESLVLLLIPQGVVHGGSARICSAALSQIIPYVQEKVDRNSSSIWEDFEVFLENCFLMENLVTEFQFQQELPISTPKFKDAFNGVFKETSFQNYDYTKFEKVIFENPFGKNEMKNTAVNSNDLAKQLKPCAESFENLLKARLGANYLYVPWPRSKGYDFRFFSKLEYKKGTTNAIDYKNSHLLAFQVKFAKPLDGKKIFSEILKNSRLFDETCDPKTYNLRNPKVNPKLEIQDLKLSIIFLCLEMTDSVANNPKGSISNENVTIFNFASTFTIDDKEIKLPENIEVIFVTDIGMKKLTGQYVFENLKKIHKTKVQEQTIPSRFSSLLDSCLIDIQEESLSATEPPTISANENVTFDKMELDQEELPLQETFNANVVIKIGEEKRISISCTGMENLKQRIIETVAPNLSSNKIILSNEKGFEFADEISFEIFAKGGLAVYATAK